MSKIINIYPANFKKSNGVILWDGKVYKVDSYGDFDYGSDHHFKLENGKVFHKYSGFDNEWKDFSYYTDTNLPQEVKDLM